MGSVDSSSSSPTSWRAPATIAAVVVMFLGLALRSRGQTSLELWADEADWAIRAVKGTDTFIAVATLAAVPAWWSMAAHKSRRHQTG